MNGARPASWPLNCPSCGDRISVEMPLDREAGFSLGASTCRRGHTLRYRYDAVSLARLERGDQYVQIPCRTCHTMTLITGNRLRPGRCARCAAPFDPDSLSGDRPKSDFEAARPDDP